MSSYRSAVSSLPTTINHSATPFYLICQFRVKPTDDPITAEAVSHMHNDGSAPTYIQALLTSTFQAQPVPPALQNAIDFTDIQYVSLSGDSPNYSVLFRTRITSITTADADYARFGSERYATLRSFLYDFVSERWHTKIDSLPDTLGVPKHQLEATHFMVPPLNSPHYIPYAFVSGVNPIAFGRNQVHLDLLTDSLHTSIKHKLDPQSKLCHLGYFRQTFGLKARSNYNFTKEHKADVYLVYFSNVADLAYLRPILFPTTTPQVHVKMLDVPVTMLPIPSRPSSAAQGRMKAYYNSVARIHQDVVTREGILNSIHTIITSCIRDPTSATTRDTLLRCKNIITFTVFISKTNILKTKLFLKVPLPQGEAEPLLRSWFNSKERALIFAQLTPTTNVANTTPDSILLNNVLKLCPTTISDYATSLGVSLPSPNFVAPTTPTTPNPSTDFFPAAPTPTAPILHDYVETTDPTPPPPPAVSDATDHLNTPSTTITTTTSTPSCSMHPPPPKPNLRPKNILKTPSLDPLIKKRPKPRSPSDDTLPVSAPAITTPLNDPVHDNWEDCASSSDEETRANQSDIPSDDDTDFSESIRLHQFEHTLTKSIPKPLRCYISKTRLTELAHHIYIADDTPTAILDSKNDLLCQVEDYELRHSRNNKKKHHKKKKNNE